MARAKSQGNGRVDRLEDALSNMLQGQALMQQQLTAIATRQAETERRIDTTLLDISRILHDHSRILEEHSRILEEHGRILAALPDAVRERMGFRPT